MYIRLSAHRTKGIYRQILNETIALLKERNHSNNSVLYQNLLLQLADLKENVVEKQKYAGWEQINNRYTIGAIATKNFDNNDELKLRLCDIFGGAIHYAEFPE